MISIEEVVRRLHRLRKLKDFSQEEVAEGVGMHPMHYWRIEKMRVSLTVKELITLAHFHGRAASEFLDDNFKLDVD
jgi:transcriptional regulator with XRE-family HTH domain